MPTPGRRAAADGLDVLVAVSAAALAPADAPKYAEAAATQTGKQQTRTRVRHAPEGGRVSQKERKQQEWQAHCEQTNGPETQRLQKLHTNGLPPHIAHALANMQRMRQVPQQ